MDVNLQELAALPYGQAKERLAAAGKLRGLKPPAPWIVAVFGGDPLVMRVFPMEGAMTKADARAGAEALFLMENREAAKSAIWSSAERKL